MAESRVAMPETEERPAVAEPEKKSPVRFVVVILLMIAVGVGVWAYFDYRDRVSTDDAEVDGFITSIAPKISGNVVDVLVNDNQPVKAGDVLVRITGATTRRGLTRRKPHWRSRRASCGRRGWACH